MPLYQLITKLLSAEHQRLTFLLNFLFVALFVSLFYSELNGKSKSDDFPAVVIKGGQTEYDIKKVMEILPDTLGIMNPDEVLTSEDFVSYNKGVFSKNVETFWVRFKTRNLSGKEIDLLVSSFFIDRLTVFRLDSTFQKIITVSDNHGYMLQPEDRAFDFYQTSLVPLKLRKNDTDQWYIKLWSERPKNHRNVEPSVRMGFVGYTMEGFERWYRYGEIFNLVMLGITFMVIVFNTTLFFWGKESNYGYLAIYNIGYLIWVFFLGGFLIFFNIVDDHLIEKSLRRTIPFAMLTIGYSFFSTDFLNLKDHYPRLTKVIRFSGLMYGSLTVLYFVGFPELATAIMQLISPVVFLGVLYGSIRIFIIYRNFRNGLFLAAVILLNFSHGFFLFAYNDPHFNYLWGHHVTQIVFLIDIILFSVITTLKFIEYKQEKILIETEKQIVQRELDKKNRQLASIVAQQANRNESLANLKKTVSNSTGDNQELKKITQEIGQIMHTNTNWDNFKLHFEDVHPNFFKILTDRYPNLTPNDHRLSAFIKMGLKNKEVATVTGVSVRAVEKARERLKKKMGVENLAAAIREIQD